MRYRKIACYVAMGIDLSFGPFADAGLTISGMMMG